MLRFRFVLLAVAVCAMNAAHTQSYEKTLGLSGTDYPTSISLLSDEGVIIGGSIQNAGNGGTDMFLTRLDAAGNSIWTKAVGTAADDTCSSIAITADSSIIACGNTYGGGLGNSDLYVVKLDLNGQLLWSKVFGQLNYDKTVKVLPTDDSGFIMCGYIDLPPVQMPVISSGTRANSFLMKFDAAGNVQWTRYYGTLSCHYTVYDMIEQANGDYLLLMTGSCQSNPPYYNSVSMIMRVNPLGQVIWHKRDFPTGYAYSYAMLPESDNGTLFAYSGGGITKTLKLDSAGAVVNHWQYGFFTDMQLFSIYDVPGDGYLLLGSVIPYPGAENGLMFFRIGNNHYPISTTYQRMNVSLGPYHQMKSVMRPSDSHITFTVGVYQQMQDIAVINLDTTGQTFCVDDSLVTVYTNVLSLPVLSTEPMSNNPPTMLTGSAVTNAIAFNFTVGSVCAVMNAVDDRRAISAIGISPNPASESVAVTWTGNEYASRSIRIYNVLGEMVHATASTENVTELDISFLSAGTYFMTFEADGVICETKRLVRE